MKKPFAFAACFLAVTVATAQNQPIAAAAPAPVENPAGGTAAAPPSAPPQRSAAELEKLVAPIALHPDPLISILLPAAAYPVEIVQAARFVKDTNNIPKIDAQPWDDNVKAVAKFPELIAKMDADLQWTVDLGVAFVEQPKELMDQIQELRGKAQKAGTLRTTPQQVVTVTNVVVLQTNVTQVVTVTNQVVQVQPSNPEVIYVPTYPPTVYYPPPGYVYDPWAPLVSFGVGMAIGAIIANNCDWYGGAIWVGGGGIWVGGGGYGDVDIDIDIDEINIDRGDRGDRVDQRSGERNRASATQQKWQPDQNRLRTSGAPATAQTREARGWGNPSTQPAQRPASAGGARPATTPAAGARPAAQPTYNFSERPAATGQQARNDIMSQGAAARQQGSTARAGTSSRGGSSPAPSQSVNRSSSGSSSAFGGVSNRSSAHSASNRGSYSRGGGGGRMGGGGGRGGGRR